MLSTDNRAYVSYDPQRQGYDSSSWHTIFGAPTLVGGYLSFKQASTVGLADVRRGQAHFQMSVSAPAAGDQKIFGLFSISKNAYAYFKIADDVLTANVSDGTNTQSEEITWQSAWSSTSTTFTIRWQAGIATFFVNGSRMSAFGGDGVPNGPLSLYFKNENDTDLMVDYIEVIGAQSYILVQDNDDSVYAPAAFISEGLTLSESLTVDASKVPSVNESMALTESVTVSVS